MSEKNVKLIRLYCQLTKRDFRAIKRWFSTLNEKGRIKALSQMRGRVLVYRGSGR